MQIFEFGRGTAAGVIDGVVEQQVILQKGQDNPVVDNGVKIFAVLAVLFVNAETHGAQMGKENALSRFGVKEGSIGIGGEFQNQLFVGGGIIRAILEEQFHEGLVGIVGRHVLLESTCSESLYIFHLGTSRRAPHASHNHTILFAGEWIVELEHFRVFPGTLTFGDEFAYRVVHVFCWVQKKEIVEQPVWH